jgi:hypothetical protein
LAGGHYHPQSVRSCPRSKPDIGLVIGVAIFGDHAAVRRRQLKIQVRAVYVASPDDEIVGPGLKRAGMGRDFRLIE